MPAIVADVRAAVATANRVIEETGADVSGFTGRLKPLTANAGATLDAATATLRDASATLARLDAAMDVAERTLTAAEATFAGANRVIDQEVAPTAADIRAAADRLATSVTEVSDDLPGDHRRAARHHGARQRRDRRRSRRWSRRAARRCATSPPPACRSSPASPRRRGRWSPRLERVAARLERDPARFLLGGQAPDYRR